MHRKLSSPPTWREFENMSRKLAHIAGAIAALCLPSAALAQSGNPTITVVGAINNPAHVQPVTDNRDAAVPEMPVIYDQAQHNAAQAQATPAASNQTDRSASADRTDLNQTVKSH
jgi:hypothetical protein